MFHYKQAKVISLRFTPNTRVPLLDVPECLENPDICQNGGTCFNLVGGYMCRCNAGWTGENCEIGGCYTILGI